MTEPTGKREFIRHLHSASHHFAADDSGKEWSLGREQMRQAAMVAVNNRWSLWDISRAHKEAEPLMARDDLLAEVIRLYRERF